MRLLGFNLPEKSVLIHAVIGGVICFIVVFLISSMASPILLQILVFLGITGVMTYQDQFLLAAGLILFGTVYLVGGFCGGLYTGYQVQENLKVTLIIPGLIGFIIYIVITYFFGQIDLSIIGMIYGFFLPLLGNLVGAYLGGYAMNWPSEEEKEEAGKLTLELPK